MSARVATGLILTALAVAAVPHAAHAQAAPFDLSAGGGIVFQTFRFSDEDAISLRSVSLVSVPIAARLSFAAPVRVELSGAFARATLDRGDGASTTVSGPTDTELRVLVDVLDSRVTLTGTVIAPTGQDTFSDDEAVLAGVLAADLLPFRISNWGSGGGVGAGVAYFQPTASGAVGLSAGFVVPGDFRPLEGDERRYEPGSVFRVQGALDRNVGPASKLTFQLGFHRYGDDALEGQNLFRTGNRIQGVGSYSFPAGTAGSAIVYLGYLHRASGTYLEALDTRPSQGLIYAGAGMRRPRGASVLAPSVEVRVLRREDGEDQGFLAGIGASLEHPAGGVLLVPTLRARFGRVLVRDELRSGFMGAEVGFAVRAGGSR